ncbi:MAG: ABC transporter substrate-binding protein, partial [Gammaproteobacteria bacterium]|nr:ABC transporter substrate-binding protein [Gammaproteobacteria bacterium]
FKLRQGVKWHDGTPFTAADVKATYDRLLNPEVKARRCGAAVRPFVDSVETVDDHTVRFNLKYPAAPFIPTIASAWCRIAAKHVLEKFGDLQSAEAQIGTGPFKFKRYERDSVVEWVRNDDYYNKDLPYLDGVKVFIIKDKSRQLAASKAGQVQLWSPWPPMSKSQADELRNARGDKVDLYQGPINALWAMHLNQNVEPFDKADIRRAVHLALNRQELIEKALEGSGVPCAVVDPKLYGKNGLPMEEVLKLPGCRADKTADIEEAKKLVAKHYPDGVDFELVTRTVGNYVDRTQLIAADLRKIGLRANIKTYESAAGYAAYAQQNYQAIAAQDTAMYVPDASGVFSILYIKGAGRNWSNWVDETVNKLADQALRETNEDKRAALYHELQRYLLTEDNVTIPVAWVEGWFFNDKRVKGFKLANTVYDNNTAQSIWLEK